MRVKSDWFIEYLDVPSSANGIIAQILSAEENVCVIKTKKREEISVWQVPNFGMIRQIASEFRQQNIHFRIWQRLEGDEFAKQYFPYFREEAVPLARPISKSVSERLKKSGVRVKVVKKQRRL